MCDRRTDIKKNIVGGVFSQNIWEGGREGASERRNENIIVSGPLKMSVKMSKTRSGFIIDPKLI
jgi:hypothetical protein